MTICFVTNVCFQLSIFEKIKLFSFFTEPQVLECLNECHCRRDSQWWIGGNLEIIEHLFVKGELSFRYLRSRYAYSGKMLFSAIFSPDMRRFITGPKCLLFRSCHKNCTNNVWTSKNGNDSVRCRYFSYRSRVSHKEKEYRSPEIVKVLESCLGFLCYNVGNHRRYFNNERYSIIFIFQKEISRKLKERKEFIVAILFHHC